MDLYYRPVDPDTSFRPLGEDRRRTGRRRKNGWDPKGPRTDGLRGTSRNPKNCDQSPQRQTTPSRRPPGRDGRRPGGGDSGRGNPGTDDQLPTRSHGRGKRLRPRNRRKKSHPPRPRKKPRPPGPRKGRRSPESGHPGNPRNRRLLHSVGSPRWEERKGEWVRPVSGRDPGPRVGPLLNVYEQGDSETPVNYRGSLLDGAGTSRRHPPKVGKPTRNHRG